MNYKEATDYLFSQVPSFEKTGKTGFNEGLANTLALDEHYGHPHRLFKTIHVAGTNGKGSVSHSLAAHLQAAGYRVGLYTSPHLIDFRERIRVDGQMISEDDVVAFVDDFLSWNNAPSPIMPSFFELTTAMAFKFFADQHVDIAVIEVGLGGRLDCTNIITPVLSVITNISLDHTDMLGHTLALISREKAGIIKHGIPVVVGESHDETRPVFETVAQDCQAPIIFADDTPLISDAAPLPYGGMHYTTTDGRQFDGDLSGLYQACNTNTVLWALQELVRLNVIKEIDYTVFAHISSDTGLMARWQRLKVNPIVICDTGHNPGGWQYLARQISSVECRQRRIVFGMVSDKDVSAVLKMLPHDAVYYFTKAMTHRAIDERQLLHMGQSSGLKGNCFPTVEDAYRAALSDSSPDDFIFVGGSTYVVSDLMRTCFMCF